MPFPESGAVSVLGGSDELKPAHLIKLPEHVWQRMEQAAKSGERVKISLESGEASIVFPDAERIPLQAHTTGTPTEIHTLDSSSSSLQPVASASARLSVPISASTSVKAAERVRTQTEARDREKKANAGRVNGVLPPKPKAPVAAVAATSMSRTQSSPVNGASGLSAGLMPSTPIVPLKTRVVQLLALGPCSQGDMVAKLGGAEADIMRVVNVVGRKTSSSTPTYELQPAQYSKIKLGEWTYSSAERLKVVTLARKAFDELKLPSDADERIDLDRKEAAAAAVRSKSSSPTSSTDASSRSAAPVVHALPVKPEPAVHSASSSRNASPAPRTSSPAPPATKPKLVNGKKDGEHRSPVSKKDSKEKSMFSKQLNKFRAEKRAASLPNGKGENGTASPRLASSPVPSSSKLPPPPNAKKERSTSAEKEKERDRKPSERRRSSRDYSSSEAESDTEPRATGKKSRDVDRPSSSAKKRPSPDYSSSTDEDHHRGRPAKRPSPPPPSKGKAPTHTPTKLNGHINASSSSSSSKAAPPKSAEDMRERYEELFPAYQQLTKKLVGVYQDCEDVEEEGKLSMSKDEVAKMAQRWQKWHNELEGIRQWFDGGNG